MQADLATFTMTLINKTLFGIPDQDTFYDQGGDSIMRSPTEGPRVTN